VCIAADSSASKAGATAARNGGPDCVNLKPRALLLNKAQARAVSILPTALLTAPGVSHSVSAAL
jgi:hypothetical protein